MEKKDLVAIVSGGIIIALVLYGAFVRMANKDKLAELVEPCRDFQQQQLVVGQQELSVFVATTEEEKKAGLSGCEYLPKNSGMYFPYEEPKQAKFWMKGMLMPIDIVWIADRKVVGVEQNIAADFSPENRIIYEAPQEIDAVLEIKAGGAAEWGIESGSEVVLDSEK